MSDESKIGLVAGVSAEKDQAKIGQIVSSVPVFYLTAKFDTGKYYFYFLNPEAVTIFLVLSGVKGEIEEIFVKKKGKKYYLSENENVLGDEIEVIEQDGKGVRQAFDVLEEKLRGVISEFKSLDFGLTASVVGQILTPEEED